MAWEPLVRSQASFRGVPFNVDTAERQGGRRGVTHEYPFRDEPFREDLGRQVRKFTVEGHVIGPDYLTTKQRLINALESPSGPGELVHPYYGTRHVAVSGFRVRESAADGGLARFSIEFEETPSKPKEPTAAVDTSTVLTTKAGAARAGVVEEFTAAYNPGVHTDSLAGAVAATAEAVSAVLQAATQDPQEAALAAARSAAVSADATTLVQSAEAVSTALVDLLDAATGLSSAQLLPVYDTDPGEHPSTVTENRVIEGENFDALQRLTQRLVVVRAAELALLEEFVSYEAALAAREAIAELLDEQADLAGDVAYPVLVELRAALVNAVPGSGSTLPRLISYTPSETVPSLVLAHRLYGSSALEGDVLARNAVPNPLFVVGGTALEVLSGG
jgi:prophage DNA circulation protein